MGAALLGVWVGACASGTASELSSGRADSSDRCAGFETARAVGVVDDSTLVEASGLVRSRTQAGILWTHNDGDYGPALYAMDDSGSVMEIFEIDGADNVDWEDISSGPGPSPGIQYLYVADTGDNHRRRERVQIYRVPEPTVVQHPGTVPEIRFVAAEARLDFVYPDGAAHDAEAVAVDPLSGDLYLVTKRTHGDSRTQLYRARAPLASGALEYVADERDVAVLDQTITGLDMTDKEIALLGDAGVVSVWQREGRALADTWIDEVACAGPAIEGQHEAVALSPMGGGYYLVAEGTSSPLIYVAEQARCESSALAVASGRLESALATEISGLVHSVRYPGVLWAVNDPGAAGDRSLIALTVDGATLAELRVTGADNHNWEDLALGTRGGDAIYISDIGNNDRTRAGGVLYRVPEPDPYHAPATIGAEPVEITLPDAIARDVESVAIDRATGELHVITRRRGASERSEWFSARADDSAGGWGPLERVADERTAPALDATIVSADVDFGGTAVALLTREGEHLLLRRPADRPLADAIYGTACRLPVPLGAKHDAVAFDPEGGRYLLPEGKLPLLQYYQP